MAQFIPLAKGSILVPSGGSKHLHIVCNDPVPYPKYSNAESVLLVNITTVYPDLPYDPTCLLEVGDHPFIGHQSYVYYRKADVFASTKLVAGVTAGDLIIKQQCPDHTFQRILDGFMQSKQVIRNVKNYYQKYIANP
ncbi:hypothetical protein [Erwinia sp. QL-Z3]|uniref:hypothetical protein n=1 Tax=Erwinia sp. QL-Z3 TaxID=2547962 RepID=UPI0010714BF2|nr:hypothetical protein [Erwinia sp. QL-Z3]QBR52713.1 hypothetical protein E2F51_23325 [Erwinia sp. QL-Z3]